MMNVCSVIVTIAISGRSLDEIFNHIVSNRLTYVQEDYSGIDDEESSVFVEAIEIRQKNQNMDMS